MELIIRSRLNLTLFQVLVLGLLTVFNLGCPGKGNGPDGDTTPPSIEAVSPAEGSIDVSVTADIQVLFSEMIDSNKITPATFGISPSVAGSFAFDGDTVTFFPLSALEYQTEYFISVTTGVTDIAGNRLQNNKSWSFTTVGNPATTPPFIISTNPVNSAINVDASASISATFSKTIDGTTLTPTSFNLSGGAPGTVSYVDSTATFIPNDTLLFNTQYIATIDTTVADTFGNKLASSYVWSFTTGDDPMIPTAAIVSPSDREIVGDTVTITALAVHPVAVTKVEFYLDGLHVSGADDLSAPYEFLWDASGETPASEHTVYARAYEAGGRIGFSDTVTLFYQWEELAIDSNDPWLTDIKRVMARSTDSLLEFRYEFWESWFDPYDTIMDDTTLDLGIYIDADQNSGTGRITFGDPPFAIPLNGIGADYRIIIGIHGWDTTLAVWNGSWQKVYDYTGFQYLNLPAYASALEFGMKWSDLGNPQAVNLLSINVFFMTTESFLPDWVPDQDSGYVRVRHENRYVGGGYTGASNRISRPNQAAATRQNPF